MSSRQIICLSILLFIDNMDILSKISMGKDCRSIHIIKIKGVPVIRIYIGNLDRPSTERRDAEKPVTAVIFCVDECRHFKGYPKYAVFLMKSDDIKIIRFLYFCPCDPFNHILFDISYFA